ncbi:unnamed protein product [Victoria cruziana]
MQVQAMETVKSRLKDYRRGSLALTSHVLLESLLESSPNNFQKVHFCLVMQGGMVAGPLMNLTQELGTFGLPSMRFCNYSCTFLKPKLE